MLFIHMGFINIKKKQILDDVVVYNYKYNIELELVQELKDLPRITNVTWNFVEKAMKKQQERERKELMHVNEEIGSEKNMTHEKVPVHRSTKEIEEWFDKLDLRYKNCIFRTTRFSLAFWKDGFFWYLYNPFRCDQFGFWDDSGYGCIMKFCSRDSLKRHLMILLLRAYVYETHFEENKPDEENDEEEKEEVNKEEESLEKEAIEDQEPKKDVFTIQIFHMIYHCCKIHNIKLLQRGAPKPKMQLVPKKELDTCPEDIIELGDTCMNEEDEFGALDTEKIEKQSWLRTMSITWARFSDTKKKKKKNQDEIIKNFMWHQYYVEEDSKLFSLWGRVSVKDEVFPEENRGRQTYACYMVCAGMTRLIAPEYWTPNTLDAILFCGDGLVLFTLTFLFLFAFITFSFSFFPIVDKNTTGDFQILFPIQRIKHCTGYNLHCTHYYTIQGASAKFEQNTI